MMPLKTNAEGYNKDLNSGVVSNQNQNEYNVYIQNRERSKQMRNIQSDIDWLKKEFHEIRNILKEISEKNNVQNNS